MSRVTCHVSRVTCHMSRVILFFFFYFIYLFFFFLDKVVELIGGGSVINGATPSSLVSPQSCNKQFIINPENLGIRIWWKNWVNYDKIGIAARKRKSNI